MELKEAPYYSLDCYIVLSKEHSALKLKDRGVTGKIFFLNVVIDLGKKL